MIPPDFNDKHLKLFLYNGLNRFEIVDFYYIYTPSNIWEVAPQPQAFIYLFIWGTVHLFFSTDAQIVNFS